MVVPTPHDIERFCVMTYYSKLARLAAVHDARAEQFERVANGFPAKLLAAFERYLGGPLGQLRLIAQEPHKHPWYWKDWTGPLGDADFDLDDGMFRAHLKIVLSHNPDPSIISATFTAVFAAFAFCPAQHGVKAGLIRRLPNGQMTKTQDFLLTDDEASYRPLFDEWLVFCREALEFDPFVSLGSPRRPIGF